MDVFTQKKRSEIMSKIRAKNTKVEVLVFRELKKRGVYFQKHYRKIKGSPDIALPRAKKAVFIDGDFWHGYKFKIQKQRLPKKYWADKIKNNIMRDKRINRELKKSGWRVMRVWEHEVVAKPKQAIDKIRNFLQDRK